MKMSVLMCSTTKGLRKMTINLDLPHRCGEKNHRPAIQPSTGHASPVEADRAYSSQFHSSPNARSALRKTSGIGFRSLQVPRAPIAMATVEYLDIPYYRPVSSWPTLGISRHLHPSTSSPSATRRPRRLPVRSSTAGTLYLHKQLSDDQAELHLRLEQEA